MNKATITCEQLKAILRYDPETGVFTWAQDMGARAKSGAVAGARDGCGYTGVKLFGRSYLAHRLAWLYVHGEWPKERIDHINGVRHDNRISNLRDVSPSVNSQNQKRARIDNSTGYLGVSRHPKGFSAIIGIDGKIKRLGVYAEPEKAHSVYLEAKRQMHSGCTI
jgi:hypothetical protein